MSTESEPTVLILMGVSGSGKTTIGVALAEALGWRFFDGDDFHPRANVDKMSRGEPLDDNDRAPWLRRLQALIAQQLDQGQSAIIASSALKRAYRELLRDGNPGARLVYLKGNFDLIHARMSGRDDHFMPKELLQSQFDALEEPDPDERPLVVAIDGSIGEIVARIRAALDAA